MISIIVPVYNVEKYLSQCLESIQKQSFSDWECILIDDGSKDKSGDICDYWANRDSRFKVIHQVNKGVSSARNSGLKLALGDFISFIDSDDWVNPNYLSDLFQYKDCDIVVSGLIIENGSNQIKTIKPDKNIIYSLDYEHLTDFVELNKKSLLFGPHTKLYKKQIINENEILFPKDYSYGEDLIMNYKYLDFVKTIGQISIANYHYRVTDNNSLSRKNRPNQFKEDYSQWKILKDFYIKKGLWSNSSKELLYERLWGIIYNGLFNQQSNKDDILNIPEITELKNYKHVFKTKSWIKYCILHRLSFIFKLYL